jgi:hypothetical protein
VYSLNAFICYWINDFDFWLKLTSWYHCLLTYFTWIHELTSHFSHCKPRNLENKDYSPTRFYETNIGWKWPNFFYPDNLKHTVTGIIVVSSKQTVFCGCNLYETTWSTKTMTYELRSDSTILYGSIFFTRLLFVLIYIPDKWNINFQIQIEDWPMLGNS